MAMIKCGNCRRDYWDTLATCPDCHVPNPTPPPPPPTQTYTAPSPTRGWLLLTGGVAIIIGSLLPWFTVSAALVGSLDVRGTDGDGVITLILGAVLALTGLALLTGKPVLQWVPLLVCAATALVLVINLPDLLDRVSTANASAYTRGSLGIGIWVIGLGVATGVFGALQTDQ